MAERRQALAARLRDRRQPRGRAGAARRRRAGRRGAARPTPRRRGRSPQERYLSVRLVAALQDLRAGGRAARRGRRALPDAAGVLAGAARLPARMARRGALARLAGRERPGAHAAAAAGRAGRRAARRLRRRAAALRRRSNARVEHPVGFDAGRWFAAAGAALATPIENPDAPALPFRLRCADLADALAALARSDGAMLDSLAWRGSESRLALAHWPQTQEMLIPARQVMRRNPWSGVGGCIFFAGDAAAERRARRLPRRAAQRAAARLRAARATASARAPAAESAPAARAVAAPSRCRRPCSPASPASPIRSTTAAGACRRRCRRCCSRSRRCASRPARSIACRRRQRRGRRATPTRARHRTASSSTAAASTSASRST